MKPGVVKYDGIRHYLISLPALVILAGLGLHYLIKWLNRITRHSQNIIIGILVLTSVILIYESILIYPFGGSYFNQGLRLAIPENIEKYFEIEYWGASYRQGIEWLNRNAVSNSIICLPFAEHLVQFYPIRGDLIYACALDSNYLMFFTRQTYLPSDLDQHFNYLNKEPIYSIERYNSNLLEIYKVK